MELDLGLVLTLAAVIFVASVMNGVAGFGFALVAVAALAVALEPRPAVVLVSLITPVLQTFQLRYHWSYRSVAPRLLPMLIAAGIGTILGANLLVVLPGYVLAIALGLFALWYVVSSLRTSPMLVTRETERRIAPRRARWRDRSRAPGPP